ncbi:MAG: glycosyltransferase [Rhodospirillales bacterium]|nr:glycosyltransferase [Rhodospirillales bacterium]
MRFLFVHQNFPGQFLHLVRHLAAMRRHEVLFLSEPNQNRIGGVRVVPYRRPPQPPVETHLAARDLDAAARRAETVATAAATLKQLGFTPDIIIGHHGWGELLNLPDVWPGVPLLGYCEFYYRIVDSDVGFDPEFPTPEADYPRIRAKNAVNLLALQLGGLGQTPTQWQHSTYPDWARERITLLPEGADLTRCKPDAKVRRTSLKIGDATIGPREKLVTYVARDLEPYRGVHSMMRALPHLLRARADLRVVIVGGNGVSYGAPPPKGSWKETLLAELNGKVDLSRVLFPGRLDYATYLKLLQRSDAHVYLTYPFVASWSLREALATGCAVIGSDTQPVREFVSDGENGRLVSFFDPKGLADTVLEVIEDRSLARRLRAGARAYAERNLDLRATLDGYEALIRRLSGAGEV